MRYILFIKKECPYCVKAQALLDEKEIIYKAVNFSLEQGTHIGLFLAMIGTFGASTGNMVHQRNLNNNFPPIQTIAYAMLYGSLVTFLITQARGAELLFEYSLSYIGSLLYLSIFIAINSTF